MRALGLVLWVGCSGPTSSPDTGDGSSGLDTPTNADPEEMTDSGNSSGSDPLPGLEPPLGATSGGAGGTAHPSGAALEADGADYVLIAPSSAVGAAEVALLVVFSGTEGATLMTQNLVAVAPYFGLDGALIAVLDGTSSSADDGAAVLDAVRAAYDVDNDRTWLLSESAGTVAGLELGFELRQSWFAAFWANDVNASRSPAANIAVLGFTPWGNAGPGGDFADADAIVAGMAAAGYALPADAPYSGPGSETHGSTDQFLVAVDFFADKSRAP